MTKTSRVGQAGRYARRATHLCPKCGGGLFRIPRRSLDRLVSAFVPMLRFRCHFFSCHWEGNLRLTRREAAALEAAADSTNALGTRTTGPSRPRKMPRSFVVNMCLAGAGLLAVFVVTTTDWLADPDVTVAERRKDEVRVTPQLADQGVKIARPAQPLAR